MRWDAYAGNLSDRQIGEVAEVLSWALSGTVSRGRSVRRYGEVLRVELAGHCAVWVGRDSGNDLIYFEGKGETSPELVQAVRKHFPSHTVARADVCEDFDAAGAFEALQAVIRQHKGDRVRGGYVALPDDAAEGRTWAAGSRGGTAFMRLYEAGKMKERAHFNRPSWVRVEGEFRPHYAADKLAAASMAPLQMWGTSAWTHRVAEALCQVPIPRYEPERQSSTFDKTTLYLARTFRRHWEEMLSDLGDWECIGRELAAVWKADDDAAEALRRK